MISQYLGLDFVQKDRRSGGLFKFNLFILGVLLSLIWTRSLAAAGDASATPAVTAVPAASAPGAIAAPASSAGQAKPQVCVVAADATAGQTKSQVCAACHGATGISSVPIWPSIAGQPEKYIIREMTEFRKGDKGTRFDPTMFGMTQNLTDQDIADLAAYFARQKPAEGVTPAAAVELGQKIYRGGNPDTGVPACQACHGPAGKGNALANFPPLSGQQAVYVADQLKKFANNTRSNDPNGMMRDISKRLTEAEIQAVSSYVSGLH